MKRIAAVWGSALLLLILNTSAFFVRANEQAWGWDYDVASQFTISDKDELYAFRDMVNGGKTFTGKTITLAADIDLNFEEWIPIGTSSAPFKGSFQGNHKVVRNLSITNNELNDAGFFGNAQGGSASVIADLTLENVSIEANHTVGALGGYMVVPTTNCHIIGDIHISGTFMVGGLAGDHYSKIIDCHVKGNEGSYVKGIYNGSNSEGDNIGGLIGLRGEGSNMIQNCGVENLNISGTRKLGGLIGAAFLSNNVEHCQVKNVVIETNASTGYALLSSSSMGLGGLIGVFNSHTPLGEIRLSTVQNIEFVIPDNLKRYAKAGYMYGVSRASGAQTPTLSDNLVTGDNKGSHNEKDNVAGITTHYAYLAPTCVEDGHIEYWTQLNRYYTDANLVNEITVDKTILATSGHSITKVEEKASTCLEEGALMHWHCDQCDGYFSDQALTNEVTREDVVLPLAAHQAVEVMEKAATCEEVGHLAHWHCPVCDRYFADAALMNELNKADVMIEKSAHIEKDAVNAKAPNCAEAGYSGDIVCEACGEVLRSGKVLPQLAHHFVDGACTECGAKDPNYILADGEKKDPNQSGQDSIERSPQTGDTTQGSMLIIVLLLISALGFIETLICSSQRK